VHPISADVPRHRTLLDCVDYHQIVHCFTGRCIVKEEKDIRIASAPLLPFCPANMFRFTELVFVVASWSLASAHTVIVYPGWRGNNIITNGTRALHDSSIIPGSLGINTVNGSNTYPYGMQWMYPCMWSQAHSLTGQ
jgi:hypothetical protein